MLKLMIVDDSNIIRRKIERSADAARFDVVGSARNGSEAVDMLRRTEPQVVTMDLTMPELDGVAAISELVAINPEVLILVVSALADKATAIEALKRGAHGFICKPFTEKELSDALKEMIHEGQEV